MGLCLSGWRARMASLLGAGQRSPYWQPFSGGQWAASPPSALPSRSAWWWTTWSWRLRVIVVESWLRLPVLRSFGRPKLEASGVP
eukprot:481708-Alexandrium_andersonii.AAC.1